MDAYVFQAGLLCADCAEKIQQEAQKANGPDWKNIVPVDADIYPQGPYPHGGGEADYPQHCDHCGLFLENPLTTDGYDYVRSCIAEERRLKAKGDVATAEWAPFYDISTGEE